MVETRMPLEDAVPNTQSAVDFLDILIALAKHKLTIAAAVIGAGTIAAIVSLLWPHSYTSSTRIMPPQHSQSLASQLLGQVGLGGALGSASLGLQNPSDMYVSMLKGRTILDAIVHRFSLKELWDSKTDADARLELESKVRIDASREGIITVELVDRDPQRAADIANAFIDELERLTLGIAVTEAGQRRLFFEKQLISAKEELTKAEIRLRTFLEDSKLALPEGQTQLAVSAAAQLRAEITAKEVQLSSMRSFATERNPNLLRTERELRSLKEQFALIAGESPSEGGDVLIALRKIPGAAQTYVQHVREVKYQEVIFELLTKQYEIAKAEEAKNATVIQVIDRAIASEKRSWPKRTLIVVISMLAAGMFAVLWVIIRESLERLQQRPEGAQKVAALVSNLRSWRNS